MLAEAGVDEGGAVVALEHERRGVDDEQRLHFLPRDVRVDVTNRSPEELSAAGEIAHGKGIWEEPIDAGSWSVEVDGPDGAWLGPVQDVDRLLIEPPPEAAIAAQDVFEFGAGEIGVHVAQGRQSDAGPEFVDGPDDNVALLACRTEDGSAKRMSREMVERVVVPPGAQGSRRQPKLLRDFAPVPSLFDETFANLDNMSAHGLFLFPFGLLTGKAAARRTFANWFLSQPLAQMIHDFYFGADERCRLGFPVVFF